MDFLSILDLHEVIVKDAPRSDFFTDLNLTQIIDRISNIWGEDVLKFYRYFPLDEESLRYRSAVYEDVREDTAYDAIRTYYTKMGEYKNAAASKERVRQKLQKHVWHLNEVLLYTEALNGLSKALKSCDAKSEGMLSFKAFLEEYVSRPEYDELSKGCRELLSELESFRIRLIYDKDRVYFSIPAEDKDAPEYTVDYTKELRKLYPDNEMKFVSPFSDSPELIGMEQELISIFMKKKPELIIKIAEYFKKTENYANETILRFTDEIAFYISYIKFERFMADKGFVMCMPTLENGSNMKAEGLYDLALALANINRDAQVVDNDFCYGENEVFYVLTGPNQGGKTTFARSLGQLVFFSKMGLRVPARSANMHYFTSLMTHFSVEESVETGRGKLMEELVRLEPMMKTPDNNGFIIINELFTTAANYDACIMGKKVLSHFIDKGFYGIYVTHLTELLESSKKAVGLCAQLDENGKQTFKILRKIMEYENAAANQVNKYGLTYDKLKERLKR